MTARTGTALCHLAFVAVLGAMATTACTENPARTLQRAVVQERIDDVRVMLASGIDPNVRTHPSAPTALASAASRNRQLVQLLLDAGADPNLASADGYAPLLSASYFGQDAIVGDLIAAGADVNPPVYERQWTPLQAAARGGYVRIVARLLEAGADPLARSSAGHTARALARSSGHSEVVALLAKAEQQHAETQAGDDPVGRNAP